MLLRPRWRHLQGRAFLRELSADAFAQTRVVNEASRTLKVEGRIARTSEST